MNRNGPESQAGERDRRSAAPLESPSAEPLEAVVAEAEVVEAEVVEAVEQVDELERLRAEAAARLDDARRIKAEFENYRKRMLREQTAHAERASSGLIERLLPVLDAFRLSLIAADRTRPANGPDYEALVRGVELVYGELIDEMRKEGLEEIEAEGKPFDPAEHEAVMETGDATEGHPYVAEVMRTGYRLRGRVLRPAMVKVERR